MTPEERAAECVPGDGPLNREYREAIAAHIREAVREAVNAQDERWGNALVTSFEKALEETLRKDFHVPSAE